jgi:hypothetical protein
MRFGLIVAMGHIVWGDKCPDLCAKLEDCAKDAHGSYCKDNSECFGLFYTDDTKTNLCFAPTNLDCFVCFLLRVSPIIYLDLLPGSMSNRGMSDRHIQYKSYLVCGRNYVFCYSLYYCKMRFLQWMYFTIANSHTCEDLCDRVERCANSPKAQYSYCKEWQEPKVCFGLYWRTSEFEEICYVVL